jgi:hypothetical protein
MPIDKKGSSIGFIPSQVKKKKVVTKLQNEKDFKFKLVCCVFLFVTANGNIIRIDISKPKTPPNLLGMDRRIAYAKRKYHSG